MQSHVVYLAAPWFTYTQKVRHDTVLKLLDQWTLNVRSPFRIFVCPPDANELVRQATFRGNLEEIRNADFVVALTDEKDPGTLWEMGYAFARGIPVVGVAIDLGDNPFNLMLAEGCVTVCRTYEELRIVLENYGDAGRFNPTSYKGDIE
jgi:nucleoside 2-deoxyribosyltransferase